MNYVRNIWNPSLWLLFHHSLELTYFFTFLFTSKRRKYKSNNVRIVINNTLLFIFIFSSSWCKNSINFSEFFYFFLIRNQIKTRSFEYSEKGFLVVFFLNSIQFLFNLMKHDKIFISVWFILFKINCIRTNVEKFYITRMTTQVFI